MKTILRVSLFCSALLFPLLSVAASPADVKDALDNSRQSLIKLMKSSDQAEQPALLEGVKQSSIAVDGAIDAVLADSASPDDVKKNVTECKGIWEASKKTRDEEILPALLAGDKDKAKQIARNVQADRFKKMQALLK